MQIRFARVAPAILALASTAWLAVPAAAFNIFPPSPQPATPIPVVEFYNAITGHYFVTADGDEMQAIDAGKSGPGWTRTGLVFKAYRRSAGGSIQEDCGLASGGSDFCGPHVYRFYGPQPNSHV